MKKVIFGIILAVYALAAVGCKHTAHGFGEDMEKAGSKLQDKTE